MDLLVILEFFKKYFIFIKMFFYFFYLDQFLEFSWNFFFEFFSLSRSGLYCMYLWIWIFLFFSECFSSLYLLNVSDFWLMFFQFFMVELGRGLFFFGDVGIFVNFYYGF